MYNKKKAAAYGFAAVLAVGILATLAPTAAAQNVRIDVTVQKKTCTTNVLTPETGLSECQMDVKLTFPATGACITNINVKYEVVQSPSYAAPLMDPPSESFTYQSSQQAPTTGASGDEKLLKTKLIITTSRKAPAFEVGQYRVQAKIEVSTGGNCNFEGGNGATTVNMQNDYFPIIETLPRQTAVRAGQNAQVLFSIDVSNLGNGQSRVTADAKHTSKAEVDALLPPPPFVVDSTATEGPAAKSSKTVFLTVRTPHQNGYTNSIFSFQVDFKAEYAGKAPAGTTLLEDDQTIFLSLQVQGVYAPGFDPVMALAAIGVGLIGFRRFGTN